MSPQGGVRAEPAEMIHGKGYRSFVDQFSQIKKKDFGNIFILVVLRYSQRNVFSKAPLIGFVFCHDQF